MDIGQIRGYGLGGRPQAASMMPNDARNGWKLAKFEVTASEVGPKRPRMTSIMPNDARNGWILAEFKVTASEVGAKRPRMTSSSLNDAK